MDELSGAELDDFRRHGRRRRWRAGEKLFRERDRSADAYLVEEGHLQVSCSLPSGQELVLAVCGFGELVGELAALDGRPRSATLSALGPAVTTSLAPAAFEEFLLAYPSRAVSLLRIVSRRLRDADLRSVEHAAVDLPGRLAARLCELAIRLGAPVSGCTGTAVGVSHDELAAWTASSREAVSKTIALFRSEGLIDTARRQIVVHDINALRMRGGSHLAV